jgi:cytochrome oxidase assembly protein ShyY1
VDTGGPSVLGVLRTPRWILFGFIAIGLAVTMIFLGRWQLHRFHERSSYNARIDQHAAAAPVPVAGALRIGRWPRTQDQFLRVTMTGTYDRKHQMLVRARTVSGNVGYEVITPLRLSDGTAVLVDRGWLPPGSAADTTAEPRVPAAPTGRVTVVGQVRMPETGAGPVQWRDGHVEVRRINTARLARTLPYPAYDGYVTLTGQTPPAAGTFVGIPIDRQDAAMNLAYIVQWWLFSGMTIVGYFLLVRWEARKRAGLAVPGDRPAGVQPHASRMSEDRVPESDDRVPEDDRTGDRVG